MKNEDITKTEAFRAWQWATMLAAAGTYPDSARSPKARSNEWMQGNVELGEARSSFNKSKAMPGHSARTLEAKDVLEKKLQRARSWSLHLTGSAQR